MFAFGLVLSHPGVKLYLSDNSYTLTTWLMGISVFTKSKADLVCLRFWTLLDYGFLYA